MDNVNGQSKGNKKSFGSVRKVLDSSSSFHQSLNTSNSFNLNKTPHHTPRSHKGSKTPNDKRLNKSGGSRAKTPIADRFIADRSNFDMAHYLLQNSDTSKQNDSSITKPNNVRSSENRGNTQNDVSVKNENSIYSRSLNEQMLGVSDLSELRVLSFASKPKCPPEGYQNALKVVYQGSSVAQTSLKKYRVVPKSPDRVLDAPDVVDDFYLNLLDWSRNNVVAIALKEQTYLWTAHTAEIVRIPCDLTERINMVTSVGWIQDGSHLVCALNNGKLQIWDVEKVKIIRTLKTSDVDERIPALHVNSHILTQGNRIGTIRHHDLRIAQHEIVTKVNAHSQEICGVKWSNDGRFYATGGNDNLVQIWDSLNMSNDMQPVCTFSEHLAAVKALCWSPSHQSVLATGGGTNDRTIKMWNISSGTMLRSTNTESQVSGLIWSENYREILSSHGFIKNQLSLWKYPEMTKVGEMMGHNSRILHMALSPDETTVATVGADETLRFWRTFPPTKSSSEIRKNKIKSAIATGFQALR